MNARTTFRTATLRGRWLLLVRVAWVALTAIVIGLHVAGIPYLYARQIGSIFGRFTPEQVRVFENFGLTPEFYAAYAVAVPVFTMLVFTAIATVIFWRRSEDRMALLSAFMFVVFGGAALTSGVPQTLAAAHPTLWFPVHLLDYLGQVAFVTFFYLFPNGRFVPRWTRWLAIAVALLYVPDIFFPGSSLDILGGPVFIGFLISLVVAQVYRYLWVSNPAERQQTKWVVSGVAVALVGFATLLIVANFVLSPESIGPLAEMAAETCVYGLISFIPLSIGVAILRSGLYEIDIIINRTLVYGALTATVVVLYVLIVGALGAVLRARGDLGVSLVAAGVVAVVFAPLRERLQRGVNRLMYGERDDPYAVLSRLGRRLEATIAPKAALTTIVETIAQALKVPYVAIDLRQHGKESATVAEHGTPKGEPLSLPLVYQREEIGRLIVEPRAPGEGFSAADRRLLEDLARQVEVAVHAVGLTADLQRSRERLVTTREEERRRLRRDLHDGLGPTLGYLTLGLDTARRLFTQDPKGAEELLVELKSQTQEAVSDVRRLVYDLRPPALDDLGLIPAIRQQAANRGNLAEGPSSRGTGWTDDNNGIVFSLEAPEEMPPLPAAVEVACYRIAQEAIANVSRHSGARSCHVMLSLSDDYEQVLMLEVEDDGTGIPEDRSAGVGMSSMRERAEELGGTLSVEAIVEGGTRLVARLPLPAKGEEE